MSDATNYLEAKLADHAFRATDYAEPATVYSCLATAVADAEAGTVTEVTNANAYARTATTFGAGSQVSGKYRISNSAQVSFPQATGSWGTVTHWLLADSGTYGAGNLMVVKALTASKAVANGDTFVFPVAALTIDTA